MSGQEVISTKSMIEWPAEKWWEVKRRSLNKELHKYVERTIEEILDLKNDEGIKKFIFIAMEDF
jgi:hypothetical protein